MNWDQLISNIEKLKIFFKTADEIDPKLLSNTNRHRRTCPRNLEKRGMGMLDARNIKITRRPRKSLDPSRYPERSTAWLTNLDCLIQWKETFVLLPGIITSSWQWPAYPDRQNPPPLCRITEKSQIEPETGDDEAEKILGSRRENRKNDPITGKDGCTIDKIKYSGDGDKTPKPEWQI